MKNVLPPFKKHFVSYTFYLIYVLCWLDTWRMEPKLRYELDGGLVVMFGFLIAILFTLITTLNTIFRSKEQTKFYLWLIVFIIIPPAIFILSSSY